MRATQHTFRSWFISCALVVSLAVVLGRPSAAATIGLNFTGANQGDSGLNVPDTMGAVGPDHIVEMLNGVYTVYDKATGSLLQRASLGQFCSSAIAAGSGGIVGECYDPRVAYDPTSDRWFAVSSGFTNGDVYVAVSRTEDPTIPTRTHPSEGWRGYRLDRDADPNTDLRWSDFPTLGISADSISISTTLLSLSTGTVQPRGYAIYSIPKADLLQPTPTIANLSQFAFDKPASLGGATTAIQGVLDFETGGGSAALFAAHPNFGLQRWDLLNTAVSQPSAATLAGPTNIPIPSFELAPPARQPGNAPDLFNYNLGHPYIGIDGTVVTDTMRMGSNLVQQGNHVWGVIVAKAGDRSGLNWYEIDTDSNTLVQSGTVSDPSLDLIFPSISVNVFGDVVIGFTATDEEKFPSAYAVVGDTRDGVTTFGALMELQAGAASFRGIDELGRNRWGDYSQTVIDPTDPFSFWTFQEFTQAQGQWAVQITQIHVDPPLTGDTDNDGDVDLDDLNNVRNNFGTTTGIVLGDTSPFDGDVDLDDLNAVRNSFGGAEGAAVPEPTTAGLVLSACAWLVLRRCDKRRSPGNALFAWRGGL